MYSPWQTIRENRTTKGLTAHVALSMVMGETSNVELSVVAQALTPTNIIIHQHQPSPGRFFNYCLEYAS